MSFLELAKKRYSSRSYTDRKVEKEKLEKILEAGRVAPTARNLQPQRILVLQEQEGLEKVSKAANVYKAPLVLVVCTDTSTVWTRPHDGYKTTEVDASIVTDHMILEATDLGLSSVWICHFKPAVLMEEFNLPESIVPVNILAIGYSDTEPKLPERVETERKPISETVYLKA
jgi:nitroreductase